MWTDAQVVLKREGMGVQQKGDACVLEGITQSQPGRDSVANGTVCVGGSSCLTQDWTGWCGGGGGGVPHHPARLGLQEGGIHKGQSVLVGSHCIGRDWGESGSGVAGYWWEQSPCHNNRRLWLHSRGKTGVGDTPRYEQEK